MKRLLMYFSGFLFLLSLFTNIATYILMDYSSFLDFTFIIHVLIFIPFGVMIISKRNTLKDNQKIIVNPITAIKLLIPHASNLAIILILLTFAFTFYNFYSSFLLLKNGSPEISNGLYIQNNHGEIINITKEKYNQLKFIEIRLFSGHWMIFSMIPFMSFFYDNKESK